MKTVNFNVTMKKLLLLLFALSAFCLAAGESYRIILLGDLHFDAEKEVYHREFLKKSRRHLKEFERNAEMWRKRMPTLLAAAAKLETPDTLMVVQLGDLIQGDCGDEKVHRKFLGDALQMLTGYFHTPVVIVTGNHEMRGEGAGEATQMYYPAHNAKALNIPVSSGNFSFARKGDSFTFLDFNSPDADVIRRAPGGRYRFLFTHGPAVADDTKNSRWMLFGKQSDTLRREMLQLYFDREMLLFAGHTHHFVYHLLEKEGKRVDQIIISSVWRSEKLKNFNLRFDDVADYGKVIASAKVVNEKEKKSKLDQQTLLCDYAPYLKQYCVANTAGFATLDVSDESVIFTLYGGDDFRRPVKTLRLR